MDLKEFEIEFSKLGSNYKTKDVNKFNKNFIKSKIDVSFLKPIVLDKQAYYRTYFQVSIENMVNVEDRIKFIEDNFELLQDWWHTDQLVQFMGKDFTFDIAYEKAKIYCNSELPFVRRWAYVMFIPRLVKDKSNTKKLFALLKNDDEYYVIMAEAWLISYLAMYNVEETYAYLSNCNLNYNIVGKAIQKICDSYVITAEDKERFKGLRNIYKKSGREIK